MPEVITDDGVKIHYCVDDFTDPWEEEAETIFMQPGLGENTKFLIPLARRLVGRYRVIRIDRRGMGKSGAPPKGSTLSGGPDESKLVDRMAKDALCVIDQLGIQRIHWFGAGGGGVTGVVFAATFPDRTKSLTICSPIYRLPTVYKTTDNEESCVAAIEKWGLYAWVERKLDIMFDPTAAGEKMKAWYLKEKGNVPTRLMVAAFTWAQSMNISSYLPGVKCPTMIFIEEKVPASRSEQRDLFREKIPNAKFVFFEGVGRGLHLFRADRLADNILDFLQSIG